MSTRELLSPFSFRNGARARNRVALGRSAIANPDWPARAAEPGWEPKRPPLTPQELRERGLSDGFIHYMRRWKGFVTA